MQEKPRVRIALLAITAQIHRTHPLAQLAHILLALHVSRARMDITAEMQLRTAFHVLLDIIVQKSLILLPATLDTTALEM
jgi:hypothetical protein